METNTTKPVADAISSLEDIATKKERVRKAINKDEERMGEMWNSMFNSKPVNGSNKWASMLNTGAGVLDGIILGWKLYRQFKKNPLFKRFR